MNDTSSGPRLSLEWRIPLLAFLAGVPALGAAVYLVWTGSYPAALRWAVSGLGLAALAGGALYLRRQVMRPLQTLSNMIAAFRVGDYSMRVRVGKPEGALGLLTTEMNLLGAMLREQRLEVLEATALLRRVMEEIDVAVMAFDSEDRLVLANRAAEELLGRSEAAVRGRTAESLDLAELLAEQTPRTLEHEFPGGRGPWEVRIRTFRQQGRSHRLVVLADLGRALREEERRAWQRLVRVLSHEINNSLAPIRSIADSLLSLLERGETGGGGGLDAAATDDDVVDDLHQGLEVIGGRAEAVARFMSSYAKLARLPEPELEPVRVSDWVERVTRLETRLDVEVDEGPDVTVRADGDQLDQLLINLVDNAVDAALETGGGVRVGWRANGHHVEVRVEDEGPGIAGSDNLFVPFFTTKEEGSGIGLALCRQIAGAHDGSVSLENRPQGDGCLARVRLPRY